ncbi:hypothetical protein TTHERM_00494780 (macronuclear) [Tetrahymena thermophila SB210]|uniref:DBF4-type domain-containing protein n=1 Tax=Tetrahymena thermophila (strain SB210) TaxID=312017 RepID=I7MHJ0_TETTS|nr:hypothetical protein TTHERM_00494780 [Tetrahymena thermophila SB210]EAS03016.2 hypothetical protein TTHERM_00494780 [Tetrahymena thermophila SB210]|eukprot:XP_001023261.2 hypothetical protein TTHERM_00494780 [Tetrahymena thermophila SB210]
MVIYFYVQHYQLCYFKIANILLSQLYFSNIQFLNEFFKKSIPKGFIFINKTICPSGQGGRLEIFWVYPRRFESCSCRFFFFFLSLLLFSQINSTSNYNKIFTIKSKFNKFYKFEDIKFLKKMNEFRMKKKCKIPNQVKSKEIQIQIDSRLILLNDQKPYNPTFIKEGQQKLYQIYEISRKKEYEQILNQAQDQTIKSQVPKSQYCCICKIKFEDYYQHIEEDLHRQKLINNEFYKQILDFGDHIYFKENDETQHDISIQPDSKQIVVQNDQNLLFDKNEFANDKQQLGNETIRIIDDDKYLEIQKWNQINSQIATFNKQFKNILKQAQTLVKSKFK